MTNEWEPKPDCFGNLTKETMSECKDCGHMNACLGVTYISAMKDVMEKQKPPSPPPGNFDPPYITAYKKPTPDQMAKACKKAFDAFIKVGFDKAEALHLTIRFTDIILPLEETRVPPEGT